VRRSTSLRLSYMFLSLLMLLVAFGRIPRDYVWGRSAPGMYKSSDTCIYTHFVTQLCTGADSTEYVVHHQRKQDRRPVPMHVLNIIFRLSRAVIGSRRRRGLLLRTKLCTPLGHPFSRDPCLSQRVRCRRKESSRSQSHLLMSFLYMCDERWALHVRYYKT